MGDTLAKNGFAMPEPFLGAHEFCCKMLQITSTKVFEFASFEQIPDPFVRIEFGRIARQAFQMETFSSTLRKEILDDLAAMDRGPIPNDEQLPSDLAQQELQEPHHIWPFVGVILDLHDQLALGSQGSYGRKMIVGQRNAQDRRLPTRRVGAHGQGQQVKGCLIDPHQGSLFLLGFFLTRPSVLLSRP